MIYTFTGIWPPPGKSNKLFCGFFKKRRRAAALPDAGAKATAPACAKRPGVRQSSGAFLAHTKHISDKKLFYFFAAGLYVSDVIVALWLKS